jgi:hypothetical protein
MYLCYDLFSFWILYHQQDRGSSPRCDCCWERLSATTEAQLDGTTRIIQHLSDSTSSPHLVTLLSTGFRAITIGDATWIFNWATDAKIHLSPSNSSVTSNYYLHYFSFEFSFGASGNSFHHHKLRNFEDGFKSGWIGYLFDFAAHSRTSFAMHLYKPIVHSQRSYFTMSCLHNFPKDWGWWMTADAAEIPTGGYTSITVEGAPALSIAPCARRNFCHSGCCSVALRLKIAMRTEKTCCCLDFVRYHLNFGQFDSLSTRIVRMTLNWLPLKSWNSDDFSFDNQG